ncbi:hypothetical protein KIL84_022415 [Mauremys mutica]|uniref:Uncharacterized protein n=1 Tax=Mauremys mutica TaxID=74926 RepID=A0A9D4B0S4_9SAUR|nr:hypothetical protein KIL84_022415 [Mauremys mutica]
MAQGGDSCKALPPSTFAPRSGSSPACAPVGVRLARGLERLQAEGAPGFKASAGEGAANVPFRARGIQAGNLILEARNRAQRPTYPTSRRDGALQHAGVVAVSRTTPAHPKKSYSKSLLAPWQYKSDPFDEHRECPQWPQEQLWCKITTQRLKEEMV